MADFEALVAEARAQAMRELRELVAAAPPRVLQKIAADLVPSLFQVGYRGEPAGLGSHWGDALARPPIDGLPTFLVRIHVGVFDALDVDRLRQAMHDVRAQQAALAIIAPSALAVGVRGAIEPIVPWLLDGDGLAHLMLQANVAVVTRVYETKAADTAYFR
ncbi:MAG TPA: hypothetical protein VF824_18120 [Thermoanaerobaculia bacterium]|jgi:hypothetical protein